MTTSFRAARMPAAPTSFVPTSAARRAFVALAVAAPLALTSACSSSDSKGATSPANSTSTWSTSPRMKESVQGSDLWAKAADSGMSAAFGTIKNTGDGDVVITGASSDAGPVQLHTTVKTAAGMEMKQTPSFTVRRGGTLTLKPGGNHLMFMNLTKALAAGDTERLTLRFVDGSTTTLAFPVRAYDGAKETYSGPADMNSSTSNTPMASMHASH